MRIFLWFFVRYGLVGGPIALVVGIVRGDWELVFGAVIWLVISLGWLLTRIGSKTKPKSEP